MEAPKAIDDPVDIRRKCEKSPFLPGPGTASLRAVLVVTLACLTDSSRPAVRSLYSIEGVERTGERCCPSCAKVRRSGATILALAAAGRSTRNAAWVSEAEVGYRPARLHSRPNAYGSRGAKSLRRAHLESLQYPENDIHTTSYDDTEDFSGATHWATVTSVVFDRHPKGVDRIGYQRDLAAMITAASTRIVLPRLREVIGTQASAHLGVPPASAFPRLRRKDGSECHAR